MDHMHLHLGMADGAGVSPGDPLFDFVVLLMQGPAADAGADPHFGSVTLLVDGAFIDQSGATPHLATLPTNAYTDASEQQLAIASAAALVTIADNADFEFGDGDFTLEAFGWEALGAYITRNVWQKNQNVDGNRELQAFANSTSVGFIVSFDGTAAVSIGHTASLTGATKYDLCWERSGDVWRTYVNGVKIGETTQAGTLFASANSFFVGPPGNQAFKACRVTKGRARYAADSYVVPSLPLPVRGT